MPGARESRGLLEGLEEFGFDNVDNQPLYQDEKKEKEKRNKVKEKTAADYLFDAEVECPVCQKQVSVKRIRRSALRLHSRDTDSMPIYKHINPLFYDIWLCNNCGYAASASTFRKPLSKVEVDLIQKKISSRWCPKEYPPLYDSDIAVERFKLALLSATVRKARNIDIAMLCLKLGWVYRTQEDAENEAKCLSHALIGFKSVYEEGPFPVAGMEESSLAFLIGELSRRVGNPQDALDYYGRVIMDRSAKNPLKEKARDQRRLIIDASPSTPDPSSSEAAVSPSRPPKKGLKSLFKRNS